MLARKITYTGNFTNESQETIFSIVRQVEMTGEVRVKGPNSMELNLEGDLANITLIQHQIKDRLGTLISDKKVEPLPFQNFVGVTFIR